MDMYDVTVLGGLNFENRLLLLHMNKYICMRDTVK